MQRIFDFIIGAGILQGIFLALFIWFKKSDKSSANKYLSLLIGTFSVNLIHSLIRTSETIPWSSGSTGTAEPFQLLLAPLLFLFIRTRIDGKKMTIKDGVHFIPFIFVIILLTILTVALTFKINIEKAPWISFSFWGLLFLQISTYFLACFFLIHKYNHSITDYFSDIEKKKMDWLRIFMTLLLIIYAGYLILFVIFFHKKDLVHFERFLSFLQCLSVFGMGITSLFFDSSDSLITIKDEILPTKKPALSKESLEELKTKLSLLMQNKKLFLNPELTLPQLALESNIPRNTLSQVINDGFGKNFYDFVNAYRVEEIIRLMRSPQTAHYKILALAFEAGFNSKPAFNASFRKITGLTPSRYRSTLN